MSKQCKGKYHGTAIKYINDDEKYCLICQQQIDMKNKRKKEVISVGTTVASSIVVGIIVIVLTGGKGGGSSQV